MGFSNFKPDVWAAALQRERDKYCVGVNLCDRSFENDVIDFGKSVKINWTRRPTVKNYVTGTAIDSAETLEGSSTVLNIDKQKYVHFMVDDIDELQANANLLQACMDEAAAAIAEEADQTIYAMYESAGTKMTATDVNSANILSVVSDAAKILYEADVPASEEIYLEISPAVYQKLWLAQVIRQNPNKEEFENGFVGYVDNFKVFMTNSIVTETESDDSVIHHCIARTKKAVAFVGQLKKMEAYRPTNSFSDAVKGLHVYGCSVVRPSEMIDIPLTVIAE